jgi:hypothetical protein
LDLFHEGGNRGGEYRQKLRQGAFAVTGLHPQFRPDYGGFLLVESTEERIRVQSDHFPWIEMLFAEVTEIKGDDDRGSAGDGRRDNVSILLVVVIRVISGS